MLCMIHPTGKPVGFLSGYVTLYYKRHGLENFVQKPEVETLPADDVKYNQASFAAFFIFAASVSNSLEFVSRSCA